MRRFLPAVLLALTACAGAAPPRHHIIYLHGRIVQEQESARPRHAEHGYYELDAIAAALRERGFIVSAERRAKGTTVDGGANHVVEQVRALMRSGVPAERITILGASMGASIALRASARLREPRLRFAVLGPCISVNVPAVAAEEGVAPAGSLLSIREESDVPSDGCPPPAASQAREIVIRTGLRHGFLYRPLPECVEPVTRFARGTPERY
jgi:alpha-beta hydrolase superfamily lysophospholipase